MKRISILIFILLLSACSSQLELGNQQYALGNYNQAAFHWNPAAKSGDPYAQFNLGLLWESGLGNTPKNKNEASQWFFLSAKQGYVPAMIKLSKIQFESNLNKAAISWLNLAARWNSEEAKVILSSKGLRIPNPDLYEQKLVNKAIAIQSYTNILSGMINAYSGVYTPQQNSVQTYQNFNHSQKAKIPKKVLTEDSCTSDYSCGVGFQCVKAPLKFKGVCMQSVNKYGTKEFKIPDSKSIGPNMNLIGKCNISTDCPIGFSCDSKFKVCVGSI